ncbi:two-component system sensor histidine kinase NtrB [Holophaga foetida]|uniref:two-component system sensor histidine kinase NtrB n=1 Tax=Holophaga foetida TaxID=35839 RepID=UPI00024750B1|nr:ATP-binding protein [Holophaga foetida]
MSNLFHLRSESPAQGAPFLPLAFRFAASFGLLVLHLALPPEMKSGEIVYLAFLALLFLESVAEALRSQRATGQLFATPSLPMIRINLVMDILLVTVLIAFQGVDQERFATIYIFPVLASAFYLGIAEIVGVGVLSSIFHIASVLLFSSGAMPDFGASGKNLGAQASMLPFILGFATLQIFATTLVVVLIRKHLETLRSTLSRSEAVVDELAALHSHVVDSMFSGLITTDMEGHITSANPAAETILHRPITIGARVEGLEFVDHTFKDRPVREHRFERTIHTAGGAARLLGGNVAPIRDGAGAEKGRLILFQDLTDIKALEERTRLAERLAAVGELSSELAHELRNPLASIQGCVQILQKGEHPKPMTDRVLNILRRESERVGAIVSDFLDFTRPRPVKIQTLWLPSILEDVRASWEMDPRCAELPLLVETVPERWISGDPLCVHQILTNLLSNARKAVKENEKPAIQVRFKLREELISIEIRDNGCGITDERLKTLFMPFSGGFEEGTGLGLSLVYQFVQQMGWSIEVESSPGQGSTFRMGVPLATAEDQSEA